MEKLVKYDSEDEEKSDDTIKIDFEGKGTGSTTKDHCDEADDHDNSNASLSNAMTESHSQPKTSDTAASTMENLESEWANFEKMLAGKNDTDDKTEEDGIITTESSAALNPDNSASTSVPNSASTVYNPYAYLSYLSANQSDANAASSQDMEKHLEEFLEKTAQAAYEEAGKVSEHSDQNRAESHSDSEHSASESGSETDHSTGSRPNSVGIEKDSSPSSTNNKTDQISSNEDKMEEEQHEEKSASPSRRRSDSASRSRHSKSRRSRSRSRRSRSRSRSRRHRRKRPSSRSRHGSRRHRRSGSRHRRSSHRSRSPRHKRSSDRHGRHRRSHRRSNSRERRRFYKRSQYTVVPTKGSTAPKTEDFKTRMKRELQQAAKDAMAGKGQATPQQALLQTMAAMHAKAQELTGVEVPKFYNQAAINPLKFAEQQQKRKLLWSKASQNTEQSLQKFQGTEVVADEKYRKLMGIKGEVKITDMSEEQKQKQNELFNKLDQEYAFARITTHTHRGMGLGVVSSMAAQTANEQFNRP